MNTSPENNYYFAIFGGAVAGSEAAFQLAEKGFKVAVFDQGILPYGKLEDGLPKWHHKLRDQEENKIDSKLNHPNVNFIPGVKLGRDISFDQIRDWGFSALILATGAWRDRPLPMDGIENYIGKGLYYQNPFVIWFNHKHEPEYTGPSYEVKDDAIVIGGGLASLDVVKILMIETVGDALKKRDIDVDLFTLEKKGVRKVLETHDLTLDDLGLKGCSLYYRRRAIDMPLSPMATDTPELLAKAQAVRQKILDNFQKKYLFRFIPCSIPVRKIVKGDQLTGITFQKTEIIENKAIPIKNSFLDVKTPLVISSIGSIPENIPGIPSDGSIFKITDPESCLIDGFDNVFAIGNAVTGKGNINESIKHSRIISEGIIENFFEIQHEEYQEWHRQTAEKVDRDMATIIDRIEKRPSLPEETITSIETRIRNLQNVKGYRGNYNDWIGKNKPPRYEEMIKNNEA